MIIREAKGSSGKAQIIIPQDPDNIFTLRRIIDIEDTLIAFTRAIKSEEYSRPDKGERIRVRILIKVQTVFFDRSVGRLRVGAS